MEKPRFRRCARLVHNARAGRSARSRQRLWWTAFRVVVLYWLLGSGVVERMPRKRL